MEPFVVLSGCSGGGKSCVLEQLRRVYPDLGDTVVVLPKVSVAERANFVLRRLSCPNGQDKRRRTDGEPAAVLNARRFP